jgi:hypothetical protein
MKQIKNPFLIVFFILILLNQSQNSFSTNSDETNEVEPYFRISNIKWKINDSYSEFYPDYTHVIFTLDVDVWVDSSSDVTVTYPDGCGVKAKLDCPSKFEKEGMICTAAFSYKTYPSGVCSFVEQIGGWIKEPSALQLPIGTYDFYIEENDQSFHTYLKISSRGSEISNDPMPTGWDEIDWSEKDWGYEYINLATIGEFNEISQELGDVAKDVVVKNEIAYIAKGSSGIVIVDLQNLEEPSVIGLYSTDFSSSHLFATEIDLYDNFAFISVGDGLLILDISTPSTPQFVNFINITIEHFKIFDDFLAVPVSNDGLYIWNISDPSNPQFLSHFSKDLMMSDVDVQEGMIYLSCIRNGLLVLNISDISSPHLIGNYSCYATNVVVNNNFAYITRFQRIMVLNISTSGNITLIDFLGDKNYHTLKFDSNYLYGIVRDEGLEVFNCSNTNIEEHKLIGRYYNPGRMHGIYIDANFIYLASEYSSLVLLDKNFEPLEYQPPSLDSIPTFNGVYLVFGMVLGVIYLVSKLEPIRKKKKREEV